LVAIGTPSEHQAVGDFVLLSCKLGVWDALVCAVRASSALAHAVATVTAEEANIVGALTRSRDHAIVRTIGLSKGAPYRRGAALLTPREVEVIDLLRQGLRNNEIASALFISPATVKVHVQHIREKLGARTRAEAIARYAEIAAEENS
jgi:DNA-binding NarL/FixJ family response regulator